MSSKAARRRAREFALQGIYQWLLSANSMLLIEEHVSQVSGFDKADRELFISLLRGTLNNVDDLQAEFAPFIHRAVHELSPVERAILLLATHELKHNLDTPYRVIINEAIELAKSYGGTDGHRFVNGVLDKLATQLRVTEVSAGRS
ncbi:transcription antitermination factor NusB [Aromatoleum aromaticum]|uniref:Transcription antitermination protein NusB n=1 Tax=Aromatoleum aromaticum (strain DSM 19018 / LMG 30748 / EbN1) TaxID=76114 RepID=NUSB_AROAE|nr:transcription antitermination factor NusB [Aromatoleum aromaticum]Q5P3H4.1 RecName: Full=Transcription antitermination protein NusB; AltName: Full=Antitermination factor NusB [Aromatoleum aromaticum EbN1]NMG54635.1 transcription antitermination factor NusB [Aromatoleum aromaticum]CAI08140.1 N utilization substance protein B,transcription termination factor [Aromatoleum aromaticum EbN1]